MLTILQVNLEQSRLFVLRARCNVMARLTKTLKKELKSVSLPGALGHTCEFVRSHIEALHGNHRKSIKMLNSVVQMAGSFTSLLFTIVEVCYNDVMCQAIEYFHITTTTSAVSTRL